jgi:high-affinity Fe2+/Pb2+ permease
VTDAATQMPRWRATIRTALAPHRRALCAVVLGAMVAFMANAVFDWGFLGLHGGKSEGVAMVIALLAFVFVFPTYDELTRQPDKGQSSDSGSL